MCAQSPDWSEYFGHQPADGSGGALALGGVGAQEAEGGDGGLAEPDGAGGA